MRNKVKYILAFFILASNSLMAQKKLDYSELINNLSKNYVNNYNKNESLKDFLSCYNINYKSFKKDKLAYEKSVRKFYNSDSQIIEFLLKYKDDNEHINNWIITEAPCLSTITLNNILKNSEAAIILIYNYLSFNCNYTIIDNPDFLKSKNNIELLIKFSEENKGIKVSILRANWKKYKANL